ncbi:FAD/NAD(P)-binding domain-containing protein [Heliocybe sulcata]|uniref:FAD/NAD(P)-binding domain-containing protein n=1 Tax=Heliocybe sulcata TaxID=5364 RepID=A0A5C3MK40_9AGAM|nr:FAD/NAD(P)-binding domain-containing protein [Heliocybe sulcata]
MNDAPRTSTKTVAVLGASFGGFHAARILAKALPPDWKVVLIDRNSHVNHLYVFPRYAVLAGHEHKAFIPPTQVFSPPHTFAHALVTRLTPTSVTFTRLSSTPPSSHPPSPYACPHPQHTIYHCPFSATETLHFDFCVYALGSRLPAPIDLWGDEGARSAIEGTPVGGEGYRGMKEEGVAWMKRMQRRVEGARSVLVVGGGALGIQFASDIAALYGPSKYVTLLHSRDTLLPRFEEELGEVVLSSLSSLGVTVLLGERVDLSTLHTEKHRVKANAALAAVHTNGEVDQETGDGAIEEEERVVKTVKGREVRAELVLLCTGQTPNTGLMADLLPDAIVPSGENKGLIRVRRTLQVAVPRRLLPLDDALTLDTTTSQAVTSRLANDGLETAYPHVFAIGDAADAFGAIKAGHNAHWQAEVAARNIVRLVHGDAELEQYVPGPPAIKVSLGLNDSAYQINGEVGTKSDCAVDLDAKVMWAHFGWKDLKDKDMLV